MDMKPAVLISHAITLSMVLVVLLFVAIAMRAGEISPLKVAATVLIPLAIGIAMRRWVPHFAEKVARPVAIAGLGLLGVSVVPLIHALWPTVIMLLGNGTLPILAAMAAMGLVQQLRGSRIERFHVFRTMACGHR